MTHHPMHVAVILAAAVAVLAVTCAPKPKPVSRPSGIVWIETHSDQRICVSQTDSHAMEDPLLNYSCVSAEDLRRLLGNLRKGSD
jgi:hypothetical protein